MTLHTSTLEVAALPLVVAMMADTMIATKNFIVDILNAVMRKETPSFDAIAVL